MGTQAVVSLAKNGKTLVKAVAGCNGMMAPKLKEAIITRSLRTIDSIYDAAKEVQFGCSDCLVVMNSNGFEGKCEELDDLYYSTFDNPYFNPRWILGTAEYTKVIELTDLEAP